MNNDSKLQRSNERAEFLHNFLMGNKALLIVIGLSIILAILSPVFLKVNNLLNICRQVCVSTLLSVGFTVILSSGHMDLSVGTLMGLCGMILGLLLQKRCPLWFALACCLAMGVLGGAMNAALITLFDLPPFVVTLATQSIFKGTNYIISKLLPIVIMNRKLVFVGQGYFLGIPMPVYVALTVVLIVWLIMNKTLFGRHVLAVGGNANAARVCGINVNKMRFAVYMVEGFCIGIAAIVMTARVASAQVSAGIGMEMDAIAAVVIGGTAMSGGNANVFGTMFGCLIVGIVNNGLNLLSIDTNWQVIAEGVLVLIAVVIDVTSRRSYAKRLSKQASMALRAEIEEHRRLQAEQEAAEKE